MVRRMDVSSQAYRSSCSLQRGALNRELQPASVALGATEQCEFKMSGGTGGIEWHARNLFRPLATGIMDEGRYRVRSDQDFVKKTQMVLVTGHAQDDRSDINASALVVESDQPLTIAPQTVNWSIGNGPIQFSSDAGAGAIWSLEGEKLGDLVTAGSQATFTPSPPPDSAPPIQLQRVRLKRNDNGKEHITESCVVMVNRPSSLRIEPFHVARQGTFAPIQFELPQGWREALSTIDKERLANVTEVDYEWSVIGEGSITTEGLYTPPASAVYSASVVRLVLLNVVSGYAIIEHGQRQGTRLASVASWNDLDSFYIRAMAAPQCYANGMQQIHIQVEINTKDPGDGNHGPISDDELQSLNFYVLNGSILEVVDVGIEPPAAGVPGTWVMRRSHNPLLESMPGSGGSSVPVPAANGRTLWDYWLQTTSTVSVEVYAIFKQSGLGGSYFNSEKVSQQNGKLRVHGIIPPTYDPADYPGFEEGERVKQQGKVVNNDRFNYMDLTVDLWKLTHVRSDRRIPFVSIDIDEADNKSAMRWASKEFEDELCSYSGFMIGGAGEEMIYDGQLTVMAAKRGLKLEEVEPDKRPAIGELLISLNRVTNFRLRYETPDDSDDLTDEERPQRNYLVRSFKFRLLDQQGNRHNLQVNYAGVERNTFVLSVQPPRS